jgi:flagellar hook assembly protein FlgD
VKVDIFDVEGRSVATLVDGQMPAGRHSVVWDGRDHTGANAAGGVYFCRVQCCDGQETLNKVIKVR